MKEIGIYVHIPFCLSKCYYCDFNSYSKKDELIEEYINAMCNEILMYAEILSEYKIKSIYIGGGTPSYIDEKYIKQILDTLMMFCIKEEVEEITIEVNPNSVTKEKLRVYKEAGVNRISIGLQSNFDDILKKIGRAHKLEDFEKALDNISEIGYNNVSVDLIYPLPSLTFDKFKDTISYVLNLKDRNIKHISIYNLELHEGTKLHFLINNGYEKLVDEDEEYEMYKYLNSKFEENGYHRYEISNYALPGYESKHNLRYWNQEEYLGFGAGASGFFLNKRYKNIENIEDYIQKTNEGYSINIDESEELDNNMLANEYIVLNLRKIDGVSITKFKTKFGYDILDSDEYKNKIDELVKQGLLEIVENNIRLTSRGLEVANIVWQQFV